ncbi:hypothetical protein R1sor_012336 [Riccia sorocarpa]|uniref:indole-3-pyruvate monooxygenase n=1 Tax=Riccia sorocarpa TaxID=122646 RepID=A0ABD3I730_9MARC
MGETKRTASDKIQKWLNEFDAALQKEDVNQALELFAEPECFWRDLLAFTWNIQTFETREEIVSMLKETLPRVKPKGWQIDGPAYVKPMMIGAGIKFETSVAWGRGFVYLKDGKCWTMMTTMWELKGHEEQVARSRPLGVRVGGVSGRKTWKQELQEEREALGHAKQPYCLIVGAGQAGLMLGAYLRVLGVPTIIVEKNARIGDTWRNRYKTLALHTPFFTDHFPYLPYPSNWPAFPSKDRVGDWMESYATLMQLDCWCSTECKGASFNEQRGHWEVVLEKKNPEDGTLETLVLTPSHLVLASGFTGFPKTPVLKGADTFEGTQFHSSQYQKGEHWKGRKAVVIGSSTSAHDICLDLWEQGASEVTMVQRSANIVVKIQTFLESRMDPDFKGTEFDNGFDLDRFDIKLAALPFKVLPRVLVPVYNRIAEKEAEFHESLRKVGFKVYMGEDGSGIPLDLVRRGGGYYIDVGASELIASEKVKLKSGVEEIRPKSIVFSDGSEVSADLIIYATGYGNTQDYIEKLISKEAAERVGRCWGLGSNTKNDPGPWERELRNMWKPLPVSNLWIASGGYSHCRFFGRHVALQLKARMEGIPTPVYSLSN